MTESGRHIYLVSAEGGGIRAAYWTGLNLAQLDILTRGQFGEEVASLSGVSGGSLGIATWLAARDIEFNPQARLELIAKFLGSDFLSPVLGGFLFLDVPRLLLGPIWLSARRDHVFEKALADQWEEIGYSDFFARPMLNLCIGGVRAAPAVFFNATDAQTGEYVPLTTALLPSQTGLPFDLLPLPSSLLDYPLSWRQPNGLENTSLAKATVAQMVSISARFPYLSPEAQVGIDASALASTKAPKTEGLWSRLWVLVDGGYFDNTGLIPTKEAIAVIEKRRQEEKEKTNPDERPFTQTVVGVIHISNDPGTPCFALPKGWQEQLSAPAKRFLAVTGQTMRCAHHLAALESSLKPNPFSPFIAPLESLLNVRTEYARRAVAELRAVVPWQFGYSLHFLGLASALEDAYGTSPKPPGHSEEEMFETATAKRLEAERDAAASQDAIERSVHSGNLNPSSADYLKHLLEWRDAVRNESLQVQCHKHFAPIAPPLGWTLSKSNQALMRCLSIRQEFSDDSLRNRFLIAPPNYWKF
jgi:hypothetical protein